MKGFGVALLVFGAIVLALGFGMDVTVATDNGRVNNIGLMNDRQNILMLGGILAIVGALFFVFSKQQTKEVVAVSDSAGKKKCQFCAELIQVDAVVCRYCQRDLISPSVEPSVGTLSDDGDVESQNLESEREPRELLTSSQIRAAIASITDEFVADKKSDNHVSVMKFFNAIRYGQVERVREMLSDNPFLVLAKDSFGNDAAKVAEKEGVRELVLFFDECLNRQDS